MPLTIQCDIVSAEKSIFSGPVEMLVASGSVGDLGIGSGARASVARLDTWPCKAH